MAADVAETGAALAVDAAEGVAGTTVADLAAAEAVETAAAVAAVAHAPATGRVTTIAAVT